MVGLGKLHFIPALVSSFTFAQEGWVVSPVATNFLQEGRCELGPVPAFVELALPRLLVVLSR